MSNKATHPALRWCLRGPLGGVTVCPHSVTGRIILACGEAWPNERGLARHVGPWKSIEEVQ